MATTDLFQQTIKEHLEARAANDSLFAEKYRNAKKNIKDCCTYIINEVKKSGKNGFLDEEIFGLAAHFYDEKNIGIGKPVANVKVIVNRSIGKANGKQMKEEKEQTPERYGKRKRKGQAAETEYGKYKQGSLFEM